MKVVLCLIIFVFLKISLSFHQTDYSFIFERYNILFYNKSYFRTFAIMERFATRYEKKYNVSACLLQDLDAHKVDLHIEGRKFQSNEYRLFPFNYSENTCASINFPKFGNYFDKYDCNFTLACNLKKDCYSCQNIYFNDSEYPPYAPRGRFKLTMRLTYNKNILLTVSEYFIQIKPRNPLERTIGT